MAWKYTPRYASPLVRMRTVIRTVIEPDTSVPLRELPEWQGSRADQTPQKPRKTLQEQFAALEAAIDTENEK